MTNIQINPVPFLFSRLVELYDINTLDSYRVRSCNLISLLKEASEVIHAFAFQHVKSFESVKPLLDELIEAIDNDECLDYSTFTKQIILAQLKEHKEGKNTDKDKMKYISTLLSKFLEENESKYLKSLFKGIDYYVQKQSIEYSKMDCFERYISEMACELIRVGYSKTFLYYKMLDFKERQDYDGFSTFLKDSINDRGTLNRDYIVIFQLYVDSEFKKMNVHGFYDKVPDKYVNRENGIFYKFGRTYSNRKFFITEVSSLDSVSAAEKGQQRMDFFIDQADLGISKMHVRASNAVVTICKDDDGLNCYEKVFLYVMDGRFPNSAIKAVSLIDNISMINQSPYISDSIKERLSSSIRHLRIANVSSELEQKFLNYWIALEFLYATPDSTVSTISRIKEHLCNILHVTYIKRNCEYLNNILKNEKAIGSNDCFWKMNEEDLEKLCVSLSSESLKYHIMHTFSILSDRKKIKSYLQKHRDNVERHIVRMYRLRNELVHEAAIKQNIANVTSNLRYYLTFTLNQLIDFSLKRVKTETPIDMDDFFIQYSIDKVLLENDSTLERAMKVSLPTYIL